MKKSLLSALATAALLLSLTGCTSAANPEDITWELVAQSEIVAIDDSTGVFVQGHIGMFGGDVDSRGLIDYKYAHLTSDGGIRQGLVSELYGSLDRAGAYPGSNIVTIYQDVTGADDVPRIEVYSCYPYPPRKDGSSPGLNLSVKTCVMPDGSDMKTDPGSEDYRVDIHVPVGSVVDSESLQPVVPAPEN